jgi:hypothetical protein
MALFLEDPGPKHANWSNEKSTLWDGSDHEKLYQSNIKDPKNCALLEKYGWIDTTIEYRFNQQRFRDDEFDNRPCGLSLGCSFTRGIGLKEEQTWPTVLSKISGLHFWNLGVGGGAMDTCTRLLDYYISKLKPRIVILLAPPKNRFELHKDGFWHVIGINLQGINTLNFQDFQKVYYAYDENSIINHRKNMLAMKQICAQYSTPFYSWESDNDTCLPSVERSDLARDLLHQGPAAQQQLAETMYQKIAPEIARL